MCTLMKISFVVFIVCVDVGLVNTARILAVFPTPSISHQVVFRSLTSELIKRGHEVTVITTDPQFPKNQSPTNLTEIDVHDFSYGLWRDVMLKKDIGSDIYFQVTAVLRTMSIIFERQLGVAEIQDIVNKKKGDFDILFLEAFVKPTLIFSHIYKIPVIQVSSFGGAPYNYEVLGAPIHPFLYPAMIHQRLYNLTNFEKIHQLYNRWRLENAFASIEEEDNRLLKRIFGKNVPCIQELSNNIDMLFLSVHSIWSDNQPVPPNVVYIRGIHKIPQKKLPNDMEKLLNESKAGVIYFSLGTNVRPSVLPQEKIQMMIKVFSDLPYDVIWKWDQDSLAGITENIKIYKWLPQLDILRHPKIKLFITQGGLQSTDEAIEAGVPLIGIPMFTDQWFNTEKYEPLKIGIKLDFPTLTEEIFKESINKVISDESYKKNIERLRNIMEDDPQTSIERAVWWTEYVLRHGGAKHLRAAGANISWVKYLELELFATVALILFLALLLSSISFYLIYRLVLRFIRYSIKVKMA